MSFVLGVLIGIYISISAVCLLFIIAKNGSLGTSFFDKAVTLMQCLSWPIILISDRAI